jgi:hypothetical protein
VTCHNNIAEIFTGECENNIDKLKGCTAADPLFRDIVFTQSRDFIN